MKCFPLLFLLGVVIDAAPLAVVGTVTVGVSVLVDAGSELPAVCSSYILEERHAM